MMLGSEPPPTTRAQPDAAVEVNASSTSRMAPPGAGSGQLHGGSVLGRILSKSSAKSYNSSVTLTGAAI